MKKEIIIELKLQLCDRNRNFDEILHSIYETIRQRDGVECFEILKPKEDVYWRWCQR